MGFLPKNPRCARPGDRTFWLSIWLIEWGLIFAALNGLAGFIALFAGKPGSEIALVVGAPMGILTVLGGWGLQTYQKKSSSRHRGQPDGRETDAATGGT